jgi:hypothetical protein
MIFIREKMGIGDWGLGIGDWGLGPIPNPHVLIINFDHNLFYNYSKIKLKIIKLIIYITNFNNIHLFVFFFEQLHYVFQDPKRHFFYQ